MLNQITLLEFFQINLGQLQAQGLAFEAVLPTMPHLESAIARGLESWPVRPRVVIGEEAKRAAFRVAHAAFAKSGTVTLELALAQVPMVTAYRAGAVEACGRRVAVREAPPPALARAGAAADATCVFVATRFA